jgi:hypothetical protein
MKKRDGLNVGWVDTSIGALLRRDAQLPQRFGAMLVTSIDSSRDLSKMLEAQEIVRRYRGCGLLGTGLVVPSDRAAEVSAAFGKTGAKAEGTWKLSADGFCTTWKGSKENCFRVQATGDKKWSIIAGTTAAAYWTK